MGNKGMLKKIGAFLVLCMALVLILPGISAWATENGASQVRYELEFTPGTGLAEELNKGNTDYAYLDLGKRTNGEKKQAFYRTLEEVVDSFWGCTDNLMLKEGEKNALLATIQTETFNLTLDELTEVYYMFKNDHPVYYFLSESVTMTESEIWILTGVVNAADRGLVEGQLDRYLGLYASCVDDTSAYATAKAFHDQLIGTLRYSYEADGLTPEDAYWAHSIEGAVCRNQGVCEAYAKTYQMLLNYYGIENLYVAGVAGGDNHVWNMVKLDDGLYYYVDAAWNDMSYSEKYFACGEKIMAASHTPNLPTGTGVAFLYELPEVSFDGYVKTISVYKEGEFLGKAEDISSAFRYCTDVNGTYKFSLENEVGFILPTGEWPEVKEIELCYNTREENGGYYIMQLCLVGDTYINSDVVFRNIGIYGDKSLGVEGLPTLHARKYTLRFEGKGNHVGTFYEDQECRIYGPEATIITNADDRFELSFSEINIGNFYLQGKRPWLLLRCGVFQCENLYIAAANALISPSRYYTYPLKVEIGTICADYSFFMSADLPGTEECLRIGAIVQKNNKDVPSSVDITYQTSSRKKVPFMEIGNSEIAINYLISYWELEGYTVDEVVAKKESCEDGALTDYYQGVLNQLMYEVFDPAHDIQNIMEYELPLINIGTTDLELVHFECLVIGPENTYASFDNDFLTLDKDGNLRRTTDRVLEVKDGVLTKARVFSLDKVTLDIPNTVTTVADNVNLSSCVEKVILPAGVQSMGEYAFSDNYAKEFVVDENNSYYTAVDGVIYTKDMEKLVVFPTAKQGEFVIPDTVKELATGAFSNRAIGLTKLTIPSSVDFITMNHFYGNGIKEIDVNCRYVANNTFINSLCESVTFGMKVEYIGYNLFGPGWELKSIYILNPDVEIEPEAFSVLQPITVYGYAGSTTEEYVKKHGEEYGLVFSALPVSSGQIEAFVTRMYSIILEREPDEGSATWINGLKDGSFTGVRVADGFVLSEEMLNKDISNEEFVKILYRAFFGREADADGLATWKNLLDAGCKKTYVFAGFANSTEFGTLCAEAGIVKGRAAEYLADRQTGLSEADYKVWCFVERMYMEVLNRTADEPGVRSWVGALQDGSMTGVQVADGFIMSEEFLAKNMTDEEYVRIMYRAFFGRDADPEGLATWTNALATGWTKQEVFAGFANSNEFGVLCEEAGIIQGK